jgi:pectinesterase
VRIARSVASALCVAALACGARTACAQGTAANVRVENTSGIERPDETIGLPWAEVRSRVRGAAAGHVRVLDASGSEVVSQVVDDDGDGTPDELIFQGSFFPGEAKRFVVDNGVPKATYPKARVYATHTMPRDDMAWESDRIGFRTYGQGLWKVDSLLSSGIDVWVKRTRDPIVEKWYAKGHDAYHIDTGEGADFFDVGQTLGAGGTAIWRNGKMYRAANFKSWKIIANGPVRTIFEMYYEPWDAEGLRVSETKRIALDAGSNLNKATSIFRVEGATSGSADIPYVIGLVKRRGMIGSESSAREWAWLSGWGPVSPKDGGHGELGTVVMMPRARVEEWKESSDHYFAVAHAKSGEPVVHYIGAGWTDSGDFRGVADWWSYLDRFAQRLATPVVVSWTPLEPVRATRGGKRE